MQEGAILKVLSDNALHSKWNLISFLALQVPYVLWSLPTSPTSSPLLPSSVLRTCCSLCAKFSPQTFSKVDEGIRRGGGERGEELERRRGGAEAWAETQEVTALLVVLLESVKSAAPPLRPPRSWAMENGAVYGPTTEEDPRPVRGARSGFAAYFSLRRLPSRRLALKVLQLVSPRPRWPSRARGQGVWPPGPPACGLGRLPSSRLLLLDLLVQEAAVSTPPVPSLSPGKGGVTSRRSAASAPQSHLRWVPGDDLGPPRVLRGSRKCVGNPGQPLRLLSLHLLLRPSSPLPAVTLHYRPKCLCLDSQVLFVYLSLVVVVFLLRARGGQFNLLDKVFRFHAWHWDGCIQEIVSQVFYIDGKRITSGWAICVYEVTEWKGQLVFACR